MLELGHLGMRAKKHHALQLVTELVNDVEDVIRLAGLEPWRAGAGWRVSMWPGYR